LFVPQGCSALVRERMANLNRAAAKWSLFELDERHDALVEIDCTDRGNVATRLVHAANESAALERFADSIARINSILPNCEVAVLSAAELAFRWRGLEFARARMGAEAPLSAANRKSFSASALKSACSRRTATTSRSSCNCSPPSATLAIPTARASTRYSACTRSAGSNRWSSPTSASSTSACNQSKDVRELYSQVPAFSASDRAMLDVLTTTRDGRLAVVELKADEDIHLPLQGLDYWSRVAVAPRRGEFPRFGYFPNRELSPQKPLLYLVAPALHVHPATDVLLRYLAPEIEWEFVGIDEHWREGVKVVFRKRPEAKRGNELLARVAS
jgi:hypothetical protein